jgi:hypothetical protein
MFETFSYLPPLSDDQIARQVDYIVNNGWTPCLEFSEPELAYTSNENCVRMGPVTCVSTKHIVFFSYAAVIQLWQPLDRPAATLSRPALPPRPGTAVAASQLAGTLVPVSSPMCSGDDA